MNIHITSTAHQFLSIYQPLYTTCIRGHYHNITVHFVLHSLWLSTYLPNNGVCLQSVVTSYKTNPNEWLVSLRAEIVTHNCWYSSCSLSSTTYAPAANVLSSHILLSAHHIWLGGSWIPHSPEVHTRVHWMTRDTMSFISRSLSQYDLDLKVCYLEQIQSSLSSSNHHAE